MLPLSIALRLRLLSTFSTPAFAAVRLSIAPPSCALLLQVMEGLLRWIKHCERRVELLKPCDPLLSSAFGARGILAAGGDSHRPFCSLPVVFAEAPAHDGECRCDIRGFCFGRRRARDDQLLVRAEHEAHLLNAQAGLVEERNVFVLVERLGSVA